MGTGGGTHGGGQCGGGAAPVVSFAKMGGGWVRGGGVIVVRGRPGRRAGGARGLMRRERGANEARGR
eukprot:3761741-Prymnesium_polylepis.1